MDQERPILLLKRQQIPTQGSQPYDSCQIGTASEATAPGQVFSQGVWPPNPGFISQGGDSSSGYVSSDQERMSIFSQNQSRGMHSDGLLHCSKSQSHPQGVAEVPWQIGAQNQGPLDFQNADRCFVKHADGDQKQTECQRRGSSTTGTRTTGGTTYNSECSSPKGATGLSFANQANFGALAGNNIFICNDQKQLLDLQNQAMYGPGSQNAQAAPTTNNKPPLSPFPKQSEKFKNQAGDLQKHKDQPLSDPETTFMSPPIEKVNRVQSYAHQRPFQISLIHNPHYIENE